MLKLIAVFFLSLIINKVSAEELITSIQPSMNLSCGEINDGTIIAQGRLAYQGKHDGFIIKPMGEVNNLGGVLIFHSPTNPNNIVKLRVMGEGWTPNQSGGNIYLTDKNYAEYSLVVVGNQVIPAGIWQINLLASVLLAN
ncbi:AfaD family invasin [Tatumella ptyseos]|uniref:AfaD family invasin n=1 Tax=Tatumella ptyseos TaxID=82987 RepID=UPI0026E9CEA8|nr:AfaD family invasin [Tatumella ptyseos]WKX25798.1 AfaD family invasin [Tatumella ptyseos]